MRCVILLNKTCFCPLNLRSSICMGSLRWFRLCRSQDHCINTHQKLFLTIMGYSVTLTVLFAVVLWSGCFTTWIEILTRDQVNPDKLGYFLFFFGRHYSSTLLVLMSIEVCFAIYFPLKSKTVCTVKTA